MWIGFDISYPKTTLKCHQKFWKRLFIEINLETVVPLFPFLVGLFMSFFFLLHLTKLIEKFLKKHVFFFLTNIIADMSGGLQHFGIVQLLMEKNRDMTTNNFQTKIIRNFIKPQSWKAWNGARLKIGGWVDY